MAVVEGSGPSLSDGNHPPRALPEQELRGLATNARVWQMASTSGSDATC